MDNKDAVTQGKKNSREDADDQSDDIFGVINKFIKKILKCCGN